MTTGDNEFLNVFNEYYPFERYIVKNPDSINYLFDDALLTEIFVPYTEVDRNNNINEDDIYVKLICNGVEFRLAYFDFEEHVRETIRYIVLQDFGQYEWQSLYVEYENLEDYVDLKEVLDEQKKLITEKYGECKVKDNFAIETISKLAGND